MTKLCIFVFQHERKNFSPLFSSQSNSVQRFYDIENFPRLNGFHTLTKMSDRPSIFVQYHRITHQYIQYTVHIFHLPVDINWYKWWLVSIGRYMILFVLLVLLVVAILLSKFFAWYFCGSAKKVHMKYLYQIFPLAILWFGSHSRILAGEKCICICIILMKLFRKQMKAISKGRPKIAKFFGWQSFVPELKLKFFGEFVHFVVSNVTQSLWICCYWVVLLGKRRSTVETLANSFYHIILFFINFST